MCGQEDRAGKRRRNYSPGEPPPPAGDPTVPEAAVTALPCPEAATTNRNLRPRPLTEANAQPNLLTAPPQPSIRANEKAPKTPPTSSRSQCRENARARARARARVPRPLRSCSGPPSQRLLVPCISSPARARARLTSRAHQFGCLSRP